MEHPRQVAATLDRIKVLVNTLGRQAPKGLISHPVTQDANTTWNGTLGDDNSRYTHQGTHL